MLSTAGSRQYNIRGPECLRPASLIEKQEGPWFSSAAQGSPPLQGGHTRVIDSEPIWPVVEAKSSKNQKAY